MTVAWFRSRPADAADRLDPCAAVIGTLESHAIEVITPANAHDFVWRERQTPVDLCVFELEPSAEAAFMWPYLFRYPGVLAITGASLHNGRAALLEQQERAPDYRAEFMFNEGHPPPVRYRRLPRGSWPMHRAAIAASRMVVVRDHALEERLCSEYPDAKLRYVPLGVAPGTSEIRSVPTALKCAVFGSGRAAVAVRAAQRAASADHSIEIVDAADRAALDQCDVVLALTWPAHGESLMAALAGMAAGKPVVLFDTEAAADWPSIDPQTWRVRGGHQPTAPPIAISLDPRDEEHSLMLALRRLAGDPGLRSSLKTAAHDWWESNATLDRAVRAWESVLDEALTLPPAPKPLDWPPHLSADGTATTREVLAKFGVEVDFLG